MTFVPAGSMFAVLQARGLEIVAYNKPALEFYRESTEPTEMRAAMLLILLRSQITNDSKEYVLSCAPPDDLRALLNEGMTLCDQKLIQNALDIKTIR